MTMTDENLFRPEAEAQLHRPEDLAGALRLVGAGHVAALLALCLATAAAVAAAVFLQVPINVGGTGVVLSSKGCWNSPSV